MGILTCMSERFGGYSEIPMQRGLVVERDMLDEVKPEARFNVERYRREHYGAVSYEDAITIAKNAQPVHRSKPAKPFASALHKGLIKELYGE